MHAAERRRVLRTRSGKKGDWTRGMGYLEGLKVGRERAGVVFGRFRLGLGSVAAGQLASHGGHGGAHRPVS